MGGNRDYSGGGGAQLLTPIHGSGNNGGLLFSDQSMGGPAVTNSAGFNELFPTATDENEKEQLEGFMMMYELVRPICRASLTEESLIERRKSRMNLKTQTMTATLKESEKTSRDALALILKQSDNSP